MGNTSVSLPGTAQQINTYILHEGKFIQRVQ